jgi:transcriptional regulator with XRE-family HTH domain
MPNPTRADNTVKSTTGIGPQDGVHAIAKALRVRSGLTLTGLAERADLAVSTISKIESGQLSPGYETIQRLAMGLGVDVAELFRPPGDSMSTGRRGITRKGHGVLHCTKHYDYEMLAADVSKKLFLPLIATIKAKSIEQFGELPSHEGEEFFFVVTGAVTLHSEHYEPVELHPGDSAFFDSRAGHALISSGKEDARIVWVSTDRDAMQTIERTRGKI